LVATFFAVTFAPVTEAPVESVTVPRIVVDVVWPKAAGQRRNAGNSFNSLVI
jgi:hypothetical protein